MQNIILAYPNLADEATLSSGSWLTALPLDNLKNRILQKVARSSDDANASTKFDIALTKDRPIKVVVLINHNISSAGLYRIRGSTVSNFSTTVYDSGWKEAWPAVYAPISLEWEQDNFWDGKLSADESAQFIHNLIEVLPTTSIARYWRVEIDDTANPDTYIQIGRLFLAGQWQPSNNIAYGASAGYETNTTLETSIGGTEYFDVRKNFRTFKFSIQDIGYNEGIQKALDMSRSQGIDKEVFLIPDPDDALNMIRRAFLGRLRTLSVLEYPYYSTNNIGFDIKEIT